MSENMKEETRPKALTFPRDIDRIEPAILTLADGGELTIQKGKYSISETLRIERSIQIIGETGNSDDVVIECTEGDCIDLDASNVTLRGLTFKASGENSFAININKGNSSIEDCIFIASDEGFSCEIISDEQPNIVFKSCTFRGGKGGVGSGCKNSSPSFESCIFEGGRIGVIIVGKGKGQFEKCEFVDNEISGMNIREQGNPYVRDCLFRNNGDGISVSDNGMGTFEKCFISKNSSNGIFVLDNGAPTICNCKITHNEGVGIGIVDDGGGRFFGNEITDNTKGSWHISESSFMNILRIDNTFGAAIKFSPNDDVITVQKGHYTISEPLLIGQNITIVGETGDPKDVIIEHNKGICIYLNAPNASLKGLTFKAAEKGSAIDINKGNSTIEDCIFIASDEEFSCEIYSDDSDDNSNSVFKSCMFQGGGGGYGVIIAVNSNFSFESCVFEDGSVGATIFGKGKGRFDKCEFIGNKGWGMGIVDQGDPFVKECNFRNNGKGISVFRNGLGTFENCIITNNSSDGISIQENAVPLIRNCKIKNNGGSGVDIYDGGGGFFDGNEITDNAKGSWNISEKAKKITFQKNFWYDREGKQIVFDNIYEAAAKGSVDDVWFFVRQGIDVCSQNEYSSCREITPLHFAATGNSNIGVLEYLILLGCNVNAKDNNGRTPLHYAAEWNPSIRILKYLIAQGADVNAMDNNGKIPLDLTENDEKQAILFFEGVKISDANYLMKLTL